MITRQSRSMVKRAEQPPYSQADTSPGPSFCTTRETKSLFIADTIFPAPSATNPVPGKPGVISFTFFWSIPNRIPLHPDDILKIWNLVKDREFRYLFRRV